ncbi:MAG TPA: proton-conducting transporter membrane subunit, partial [Thermomicrobiaceae bacterium]|nr:proton-conducting transporter membrane subunit [Thermomicrobiaceae bacterium]
ATGLYGAMIVMLSHGFVTSALFLCVGVIYSRGHTRLIERFGGLAKNMPVYASFFGLFMLASVGLPGLSGFVGEFLSVLGAFRVERVYGIFSLVVIILAGWYMMRMYERVVWRRAPGEPPDPEDPASRVTPPGEPGAGTAAARPPQPVAGGSGPFADDPHFVPPQTFRDLNWKEVLQFVPLAALTIWLGVYPQWFMDILKPALMMIARPFGGVGF